MEKLKALGRWPNAPLAYLIAEIKFQRLHDFDARLPALAELLADQYPLEESSSFETTIEPGSQPVVEVLRDFKNFESTMGVRLSRTGIALHCTDYAGWDDGFQEQWFNVLDRLTSDSRPRVLLRSSLRCVDLLVPNGEESPDEYLAHGLRPWGDGHKELGEFEQGNHATRFKRGDVSTTLMIFSRIKGQILLPPTLTAMSLVLSPVQMKAAQFQQSTGRPFAIMDTDVAQDNARPFDLGLLKAQYDELHRLSSSTFKAATTTEAQALWQQL